MKFLFFFQAEDGIRDRNVTGVQTCALPISPEERVAVLERAADLLAARRHRMTALIVREVGKPWEDADAEVCEAIDFLRYYALSARRLHDDLIQVPGERNELRLPPRGP